MLLPVSAASLRGGYLGAGWDLGGSTGLEELVALQSTLLVSSKSLTPEPWQLKPGRYVVHDCSKDHEFDNIPPHLREAHNAKWSDCAWDPVSPQPPPRKRPSVASERYFAGRMQKETQDWVTNVLDGTPLVRRESLDRQHAPYHNSIVAFLNSIGFPSLRNLEGTAEYENNWFKLSLSGNERLSVKPQQQYRIGTDQLRVRSYARL